MAEASRVRLTLLSNIKQSVWQLLKEAKTLHATKIGTSPKKDFRPLYIGHLWATFFCNAHQSKAHAEKY